MPNFCPSPLDDADMDVLEAVAAKANAFIRQARYAPMYVALDAGNVDQQNGYLLLCWPALDRKASRGARQVFDCIADTAEDLYGAQMVQTNPGGAPDATKL